MPQPRPSRDREGRECNLPEALRPALTAAVPAVAAVPATAAVTAAAVLAAAVPAAGGR